MKPITASAFAVAGAALWWGRAGGRSTRRARAAAAAGALVALAGGLTLAQWILGVDLGIDRLILAERTLEGATSPFPGRMSPATAAAFLLLGAALLLAAVGGPRARPWRDGLAVACALAAWIALNGYALDVRALYRTYAFSSMALHTATLFLLLALGVLALHPEAGLARLAGADDLGGRLARALLPVAALLPLALALAASWATRARYVEPALHEALFGIVYCVVFVAAVLVAARAAGRLEAEVRAAQAQAVQAARLATVGTLAAGVAHEINNPLAYLTASLAYLEERREAAPAVAFWDAEAREALRDAQEGAVRVREIVKGLRSYSRGAEEARAPLRLEPVLESAIRVSAAEWKHCARLVRDFGPTPLVLADEGRLGQVFLNLLVNAAQAIGQGRAEANEIRVSARTGPDGGAVVEVRDTGAGIGPEVAARLFDPFFTTRPVGAGTGLGLTISRNIVEALGGRIEAEGAPGAGACFRVHLPAAPPDARPAPRLPAPRPAAAPAARLRVLVIDDEPALRAAVRRSLAGAHEVEAIASAGDAIRRARAGERWDAILCDLMMPDATGMDLHAALGLIDPGQAARTVFMTGGAFTEEARAFLERLPNPRLAKPFTPGELEAALRRAAGRGD
jgi:signal transduction histidine kinase/CheY-like chemotaxis protein